MLYLWLPPACPIQPYTKKVDRIFFSNLKHSFDGWNNFFLQFGHSYFSSFPRLVGFYGGAPHTGNAAFIMVVIYWSAVSVCFCCTTCLEQSAVIVWSFSAVDMFAAYSLVPDSDSSSSST